MGRDLHKNIQVKLRLLMTKLAKIVWGRKSVDCKGRNKRRLVGEMKRRSVAQNTEIKLEFGRSKYEKASRINKSAEKCPKRPETSCASVLQKQIRTCMFLLSAFS